MQDTVERILTLAGEAAILVRGNTILSANQRARELLGSDCQGRSLSSVFGAELGQIQAPVFLSQQNVDGKPMTLRCSAVPGGKLLFLSPVPPVRELMDRPVLQALGHHLTAMDLSTETLRLQLEDREEREMLALLRSVTARQFALRRTVENAGILLRYGDALPREELCLAEPNRLFAGILEGLAAFLPNRRFETDLKPLGTIPCSPVLLKSLFSNLVSNALLHTGEGSTVRVGLSETPKQLLLTVSDDGEGIPMSELPRVFERYRHSIPLDRAGSGAGLGLSVCLRITQLHGGTLLLESREGAGTRVTASLCRDTAGLTLLQPDPDSLLSVRDLLTGFADCLPDDCFSERYMD